MHHLAIEKTICSSINDDLHSGWPFGDGCCLVVEHVGTGQKESANEHPNLSLPSGSSGKAVMALTHRHYLRIGQAEDPIT